MEHNYSSMGDQTMNFGMYNQLHPTALSRRNYICRNPDVVLALLC